MGCDALEHHAYNLSVGLVLFYWIASFILTRTGGFAPGWQLRCPRCGRTGDASQAGIIRIGAASVGKRILGRCSECKRLRWLALEPKPDPNSR
jgi:hypothetical protein